MCFYSSQDPGEFLLPHLPATASHIVLKPNLGYQKVHPATVRPALLKVIIQQLRNRFPRAKISLIEGVTHKGSAADSFAYHGLMELRDTQQLDFLDSDDGPFLALANPLQKAHRFSEFFVPEAIIQADLCISVAPFKRTLLNDHPLISGTLKNLFGLFPREKYKARSPHSRGQLHRPSVHRVLVDVYATVAPRFSLGILDLHEWYDAPDWRPDRGKAYPCGQILVGSDLLQVDLAGCRLLNIPASGYLQQLAEAKKEGNDTLG